MKFSPKITKEEVNLLEPAEFTGKIVLVDKKTQINEAVEYLKAQKIVGVDTETRPSFVRGTHYKVSLMQIATDDCCYLFRLNKIGFPHELLDFLSDTNIKKIGLSLHDDFRSLNKRNKIKPNNFVDIQSIAKDYGILELGLQKIYAIIFGKKISKSQRLTNWENETLTEQQKRYAATDAWACLKIYKELLKEQKITKKELQMLIMEFSQPIEKTNSNF
ncbi:3'-5' exonuclease [uncultured Paludibacter sp.]|nr:3'-5' exonuclease [uncultured Paludibacter sp.]